MSIEAISHIMRTHIPDGVAKLVAMVLADYADPVTGRCWPKIPTLAIQCSQCERTVQRKLKVLEDLDVLHVEPNTSGDRKGNVYVLHLPGAERGGPPRKGRSTSPATGDTDAGGAPAAPSTGDTQSPVPSPDEARPVTPTGDSADTRRVTLRSPPKNPPGDSTRESPRREIPDVALPPAAAGAATAPKGAPSPRAVLCPDDFEPEGRHVAAAEAAGFDRRFVREAAAAMRRWSHANAHRPIARKADWGLAFDAFLATALREAAERRRREAARTRAPQRRPSTHGPLSLLADLCGVPHDAHGDRHQNFDLGPVIDDAGDGRVHWTVRERAGGFAGQARAETYRHLTGAEC